MSINNAEARPRLLQIFVDSEKRHHTLILLLVAVAVALSAIMSIHGWDYYLLPQVLRPLSAKHRQLRPSGSVGLKLGILGFFLFALVYLYPLRKRWSWLARQGKSKHWLNFHMLLGLVAPVAITFHSALKVHGFAGMAYWTMIALAISGLIGRYFYAQIPRTLGAAEMTLKEMRELSEQLMEELRVQRVFGASQLAELFRLPEGQRVRNMSLLTALFQMVRLDLRRAGKIWSLRRQATGNWGRVLTLGGVLPIGRDELERAISQVTEQAALSKRIIFLSTAERVFHLWHVIHRPFSLSFAVFVIIHVVVVISLGYF